MNIKCRLHQGGRSDKGSRARKVGGESIVNKMSVAFTVARRQFPPFSTPPPQPFSFFPLLALHLKQLSLCCPQASVISLPPPALTLPLPVPSFTPLPLLLLPSVFWRPATSLLWPQMMMNATWSGCETRNWNWNCNWARCLWLCRCRCCYHCHCLCLCLGNCCNCLPTALARANASSNVQQQQQQQLHAMPKKQKLQ